MDMLKFKAKIEIIGVNPFVFLQEKVLQKVFKQAGKDFEKALRENKEAKKCLTACDYPCNWRSIDISVT